MFCVSIILIWLLLQFVECPSRCFSDFDDLLNAPKPLPSSNWNLSLPPTSCAAAIYCSNLNTHKRWLLIKIGSLQLSYEHIHEVQHSQHYQDYWAALALVQQCRQKRNVVCEVQTCYVQRSNSTTSGGIIVKLNLSSLPSIAFLV